MVDSLCFYDQPSTAKNKQSRSAPNLTISRAAVKAWRSYSDAMIGLYLQRTASNVIPGDTLRKGK